MSWVTLAEAREKAREARKIAREGGDPIAARKALVVCPTFAEAAIKVHAEQIVGQGRNGEHKAQWINTLTTYAFPQIGEKSVREITQADILAVLSPIWTEKHETARRVRQRVRTVMDWARTAGHFEGVNPVEGVEKGLANAKLDRERADLSDREAVALETLISEHEGNDPLSQRIQAFEVSDNVSDLVNLVRDMEAKEEWGLLKEYSGRLFERTKSLSDFERHLRSHTEVGDFQGAVDTITKHSDFVGQSLMIKKIWSWALFETGKLNECRLSLDVINFLGSAQQIELTFEQEHSSLLDNNFQKIGAAIRCE